MLENLLLYYQVNKKAQAKQNFLFLSTFIFMSFSSIREFALSLNEPYTLSSSFEFKVFDGKNYADLLIQVLGDIIQFGPSILSSMYKTIVSIIANVMPYVKQISRNSTEAILKMLKILMNKMHKNIDFAYGVGNLLESINYVLMYQDGNNEDMRIMLLNHKEIFIGLANYEPPVGKGVNETMAYEGGEEEEEEAEDLDDKVEI
jgi:hypothetical protein